MLSIKMHVNNTEVKFVFPLKSKIFANEKQVTN